MHKMQEKDEGWGARGVVTIGLHVRLPGWSVRAHKVYDSIAFDEMTAAPRQRASSKTTLMYDNCGASEPERGFTVAQSLTKENTQSQECHRFKPTSTRFECSS